MPRFMIRATALLVSLALLAGCANVQLARPGEARYARQLVFTISDARSSETYAAAGPFATTDEDEADSLIRKILKFHGLKKIAQWSIQALGLEAIVAEVSSRKTVDEVISALESDGRIESAQPVLTYKVLSYNDPYLPLQKSVKRNEIEKIHALATGKDVVVGVVDTGIDREHPELARRVIYSRNFVAHDGRFDSDEHGTAVAGLMGAEANNQLGIVGVAPEIKLMVFKACWQEVRQANCDSISLMRALIDALEQGPDIINLSLAGPDDPLIRRLLEGAAERGIILVGAVDPGQRSSFPASMDEVIAVSTPQAPEDLPDYGVLAPGTDILTTTPGGTYGFMSGNSMATAYVSGIAALLKERQPGLSGRDIMDRLQASSTARINRLPVVDVCTAMAGDGGQICPSAAIVYSTDGASAP